MTCGNPLPGYDAWKLASPYDDEKECRICDAVFVGDGTLCRECREHDHFAEADAAYDRLRAERDARPGDADYVAPIEDDCDF